MLICAQPKREYNPYKDIGLRKTDEMDIPKKGDLCRPMYDTVKDAMKKSGTLHAAVFFGAHFSGNPEDDPDETLKKIDTLLVVKDKEKDAHDDFHKLFVRGLWDAGVRGGIAAMTKREIYEQGGLSKWALDIPARKVTV